MIYTLGGSKVGESSNRESIVLFSRRFTDRKKVGGSIYSWKKPGMTDLFKNHECLVKYLPKQ